MAATPSLLIRKSFNYKAGTRLWSNRYHFAGGTPTDAAHWQTFADLVVTDEADIYESYMEITEAVGYAAGSDVPVWSKAYTTFGTGSFASGKSVPGECAALLRYSTAARSVKNHPIYLFNYFHGADGQTGVGADLLNSAQKTAIEEYGTDWIAGYSDGVNTYTRAGPNGAAATSRTVGVYLTHRDFRD